MIGVSYKLQTGHVPEIFGWKQNRIWGTPSDIDDPSRHGLPRLPAWSFSDKQHHIVSSKPILIRISKGEDSFFAENDNLCVYAIGDTREEAVQDFIEQIIHQWKHYQNTPLSRMTGDAVRLKGLYKDIFEEMDLP